MFKPVNSGRAEQIKEKTADESADNSKGDVEPETLTLSTNDLASDEPSNQAEDDPADDPDLSTSFYRCDCHIDNNSAPWCGFRHHVSQWVVNARDGGVAIRQYAVITDVIAHSVVLLAAVWEVPAPSPG